MNLFALSPEWLVTMAAALLVVAAVEDAWRLQISNWISIALAALAGMAALLAVPIVDLWQNVALMLGVLWLGTFLFARGMMGGGDVKLLAAVALFVDLSAGWRMLVAIAILGGLEAIIVMSLRAVPVPASARERVALLRSGRDLPYGIAIVLGALCTLWWSRL